MGSDLTAHPPGGVGDHAEIAVVPAVVGGVEGGRAPCRLNPDAGASEVLDDLRVVEDRLLIRTPPGDFVGLGIARRDVNSHDPTGRVEARRPAVADRSAVEGGRPLGGGSLATALEIALTDVIHEEHTARAQRRDHALGHRGEHVGVHNVAEAVPEENGRIELLAGAPSAQVSDVELDAGVAREQGLRLGDTGRREVDTDDVLHAGVEQGPNVPSGAEAREEHRAGRETDEVERDLHLRAAELGVVVDVAIELGHGVVVRRDVELEQRRLPQVRSQRESLPGR